MASTINQPHVRRSLKMMFSAILALIDDDENEPGPNHDIRLAALRGVSVLDRLDKAEKDDGTCHAP